MTYLIYAWFSCAFMFVRNIKQINSLGKFTCDIFIKMFEKYPESRNCFTKFKDAQTEEFESNSKLLKDLKAHSVRVFQLVEKVILNMDHNLEKVGFILA